MQRSRSAPDHHRAPVSRPRHGPRNLDGCPHGPKEHTPGADAWRVKAPPRPWQAATPALLALLALAAWRLDRTSLWVDEVFSLAATHRLGLSLRSTKGTMGLYYLALWVWARASTATWWLRAFSTIGAATTLVLVAMIARRAGRTWSALAAPLLLVAVPIFAWTAVEARSYAWESALVAGCWLLLLRGIDASARGDAHAPRWWQALAVCCAIGPFLHGLFILQVPGLALVALVDRTDRHAALRRIGPAGIAALLPTALIAAAGGTNMGASWADTPAAQLRTLRTWFLGPQAWVAIPLGLAAATGAVLTVRAADRARNPAERAAHLAPLLWGIGGIAGGLLVAAAGGPFAPYYLAPSAAGLALLATVALDGVTSHPGPTATVASAPPHPTAHPLMPTRFHAIAAVVCAAVLVVAGIGAVRRPLALVEDWRGAAKAVAAGVDPGDAIVFAGNPGSSSGTASTRLGFEAAWREVPHRATPFVLSHPRPLGMPVRDEPATPIADIQRRWATFDRVWVIDYQGLAASSRLLDTPTITARYCVTDEEHFTPSITVRLFQRRTPGTRCLPP